MGGIRIRVVAALGATLALAGPAAAEAYEVGAATRDITPAGRINVGGNGLGTTGSLTGPLVAPGGQDEAKGERLQSRAIVFADGADVVALADIETQGMFAAYEDGPYGLHDMAQEVEERTGGALPADHVLIASDHSHSSPDTIGAWGGVSDAYLQFIHDQTVDAIVAAFLARRPATLRAGSSDASDLIYNQSCSEALNQGKQPTYPGPEVCATPGKDGEVRVLQAVEVLPPPPPPSDRKPKKKDPPPPPPPEPQVIATFMAYAAHATAGGGDGLHGDWPQFLSDAMAARYGGVGMAMVGALGGTQPCRTACAFTKPENPGYNIANRKQAIVQNYAAHVERALATAQPVEGPVAAGKRFIREPITGPAVMALFAAGSHNQARLLRSRQNPWVVGNTIRTVASALRVGDVLFAGTPGEGFPAIGAGVRNAVEGEDHVIQLGLANDQLGYLIAPVRYVPVIAAEAPVNDNIIFNVSPTIGDHVMCADIALSFELGFEGSSPAECAPYDAADSAGDPVASVPVGGVPDPVVE